MKELDDLLCDLYAYVDEHRASKAGENHPDWEPEHGSKPTVYEDRLKERILAALKRIRIVS